MNYLGVMTAANGAILTVRPIGPTDVDRLERMFYRLSPTTVYRRFFSPIQEPSRRMLTWFTNVDHDRREALVAVHGNEIVAVARYDGQPGSADAEIAVTVEDAWQHQGIGHASPAGSRPARWTTASSGSSAPCFPTTERRSASCTGSRGTRAFGSAMAPTRRWRRCRARADAVQRARLPPRPAPTGGRSRSR